MPEHVVDAHRTAVLSIDLQVAFVDGILASPSSRAVVEMMNQVTAASRAGGMMVVHTRYIIPSKSPGVITSFVPSAVIEALSERSPSARLHPAVEVGPDDILLDKPRYGSFHQTDLEDTLRAKGIDTLIIGGIATNICCETTAREAAVRDFNVLFLSDGTGTSDMNGVSAEALQRATVATLALAFAEVLTVETVLRRIRQGLRTG